MNVVYLSNQLTRDNDATDEAILRLLSSRGNYTLAYIPSQADHSRKYYIQAKSYYERMGIKVADYFDLVDEYHVDWTDDLMQTGAIHLSGGSTYHFLQNLLHRRFSIFLCNFLCCTGARDLRLWWTNNRHLHPIC